MLLNKTKALAKKVFLSLSQDNLKRSDAILKQNFKKRIKNKTARIRAKPPECSDCLLGFMEQ